MNICFRLLFLWFLLQHPVMSFSQGGSIIAGARTAAMAGAGVNLKDVFAITNNISGITSLKKMAVGVYAENRFNLKALSTVSLLGVYPLAKSGAVGLEFSRFGDKLYNEQQIGLGFAHQLGTVSLGVKATLWQVHLEELGSKRTLAFSFGGQSEIIPNLVVGAHIFNLNQAKLASYQNERLPTRMTAGLTYKPNQKVLLSLQTDKNLTSAADFKAAIEYFVIPKLGFRTGISSATQSATGGFGFKAKSFQFDYALGGHAVLGVSNHVSVAYQFE